jgi:hypothetical protein
MIANSQANPDHADSLENKIFARLTKLLGFEPCWEILEIIIYDLFNEKKLLCVSDGELVESFQGVDRWFHV